MDTTQAVTHIGLCAGYGGIELGLHRAIPNLRSVALCEIEAFAVANLVAKMEAGFMDPAPVWPNLKTFPWSDFRDRVDILTGGYPCQPFSAAGQRKGKQDPRHLWPWIADGIRLLRPRICFFENVEGHISLGLSDVIEDLAGMGYRTTWGIFSASEVGAPHQRKRVFILAVASSLGGASGLSGPFTGHEGQPGESDDGGGQDVGNAISQGPQGHWGERGHEEGGSEIQTGGIRCSAWPSRPGEQQYGWEPPRVVENTRHKRQAKQQIDADRTEQSDIRQTQPALGGNPDGSSGRLDYAQLCVSGDNRANELRLLGNGVVPATASLAFRTLARKILG
jgi:DNA (cytosine-5)-methyltransferase 1